MFKRKSKNERSERIHTSSSEESIQKEIKEIVTIDLAMLKSVNETLQYVTRLDYVKDMLLDVAKQSEMVESIAASSEEMTASIDDVSNYVQESAEKTKDSIVVVGTSLEGLSDAFKQIEKTFEESQKVQVTMRKVNNEAERIKEIVNVIKGIADQTNLLALNASIEAARAGEEGRGFAVVANEIKKLADSSRDQVDVISGIVGQLTKDINETNRAFELSTDMFNEGKTDMEGAVQSLEGMRSHLDDIGSAFMEVSANIEEQTATSQEMSSAIMVVNEKTKTIQSETIRTGEAIFKVSQMLDQMRLKGLNEASDVDRKTQVEMCISDHLIWRWRVYNMILGYEKLTEEQVGTHHTCRLGKWVTNVGRQDASIHTILDSMERPHADLHTIAKEAIKAYNAGNMAHAERKLEELDSASKEVVKYLESIKRK